LGCEVEKRRLREGEKVKQWKSGKVEKWKSGKVELKIRMRMRMREIWCLGCEGRSESE